MSSSVLPSIKQENNVNFTSSPLSSVKAPAKIMDFTTSILLTVIFLILIVCFYNWLFTSWDYWISRGIPSVPRPLPIFGNALSVFRLHENYSVFCTKIYEAYQGKSMVGFYNLKTPVLMVRDPELVKIVLQTNFNNFQNNGSELDVETNPLIGCDPFFLSGQAWKKSRATFVSALSATRIKIMSFAIANVCKKLENHLAEKIGNKSYLELEANFLFSRYSTEVAAGCVFDIEGNSFADNYKGTLFDCMKITMDPTKIKAFKNNVVFFFPPLNKFMKMRIIPLEVDKYFRQLVKDLEDLRQKDNLPKNDVLQLMLDLAKSGKISKIEAIGHVFSFFLESYVTSSPTPSFMSYFIAKYQDVQTRLREEVKMVLGKYDGQLTYEAINEMNYLDQVMKETLRLFPASGALTRICSEPCRLEGHDGLTVDVEPGTAVLIPALGLQMDPTIWKNPSEFNPERFEKSNSDERHKFVHLPFGSGPRACPGQRHAVIQIKAAMITVLKNYRIELSPKMQEPVRIDPAYAMITAVGGLWIKLRPL